MIYEVHRKVYNNIGDYYCNPSKYFNFSEVTSGEIMYNDFPVKDNILIIGGGGLIHKKFQLHIQNILNKSPKFSVLWGIGHNFGKKHVKKQGSNVYYPKWIDEVDLVGIRDWIPGQEKYYLPCVSCMHNTFNKSYKSQYEFVYFTHAFKSKYTLNNYPHMSNNEMNFDKVIEFLGSGNTVITDSYHGAYWAQLLGKNVIVSSWSVKFDHMKYPPKFINSINDTPIIINNRLDGFLEECRHLNEVFYQKFLSCL